MIKIIGGMVAGFVLSCMFFFGAKAILPANADSKGNSDNSTRGLAGLLPDFEKIYQQALTLPFQKAESKISDPEIADYYHELINSTGLSGTQVEK
jgi:hypothetical protein